MSARSEASRLSGAAEVDPAAADQDVARARARARRRVLVIALRIGLAVVVLGVWEAGTRICCYGNDSATCVIDKFFYGQPSGIWDQFVRWVQNGTAQGPLWEQIVVTLEETVLGFAIGVILGVIFGVALGRNRLLSDVAGPYIKALNAMPRVVLGSIFTIALGLEMPSKVALAVVLVFFVVFFNAFQGVREVERDPRSDHLITREEKGGNMRNRIWALAIIATVLAAACGGAATPSTAPSAAGSAAAASAATAAPAKLSIMVGGMSKQIYLPNKLTEALGYFKDQNLTVDLIDEPSGKDTTVEVVAGNVDMGSGSYDHTIDIAAQGKSIQMVTLLLQAPGEAVLVSSKTAATFKSPKDWKGLNAGVTSIGSGTHTIMRALTIKAGLQVADVNYVAAGAGDTFIAAMKQGKIDIGITTQPTVLRLLQSGDAKMHRDLFTPESTPAALRGDHPCPPTSPKEP